MSNHRDDLVSVLSRMIFGSFGLLIFVSLISVWFFSNTLSDVGNRAQQLLESSHVLTASNRAIVEARLYSIFYNSTLEPFLKQEITRLTEHINYHARRVFMSADALTTTSSFLTDNRRALNVGGSIFWETILKSSQSFFDTTKLIILISLISSVICLFFIGFFGFFRVTSKISWERQAVLNLFLWVPTITCRSIVSELNLKIKNFGRKHQRDPDFEDIFESSDVEESRLDQSNSVEEETRTDDSVSVSIKSDSDVQHDFDIEFRFKFVSLSVVIFLSLISLVLIFRFNAVSNSHEDYLTALMAGQYLENSAVDLVVLDYILTSRIYGLINSGDLFFYQSYWSFLNAGARETIIESLLYDHDVSNQIKTLIVETSVFRDRLLYFDNIAQVLAAQVYKFNSNELFELDGFTYDLKSETVLARDKIVYNDIEYWYSDVESDLLIPDEEKLKVIRSTISSARYDDVLLQSTNKLWRVFELLETQVEDNVTRYFSMASAQCWISVIFIVLFILLLFVPFHLYRQLHRKSILKYFLIATCVLLLFISTCVLALFVLHQYELRSIRDTSTVVMNLVEQYNADRFVVRGSLDAYQNYWTHRKVFEGNIANIKILAKTRGTLVDDVLQRVDDQFDSIDAVYARLFHVQEISLTLSGSAFDYPINVTSELIGVDWDVSQEVDYPVTRLKQRSVPLSHRYTNKTFDMKTRDAAEKLELARTLIMSREFFSVIAASYYDYLAGPNSDILSEFSNTLDSFRFPLHFVFSQYLIFALACFSLVLSVLFIIICSPRKTTTNHIKQTINLIMIKKFNRQSSFSLLWLGLTLSLFFGVCLYNTVILEQWPTQLQESGYRVTLVFRILGQVLDAVFFPKTRDASIRLVDQNLGQLEEVHNSLLFQTKSKIQKASAGRYAPQNELLFNTKFNIHEFNSTTAAEFGLNFLVNKFIVLCYSIVNQEKGVYWDFDNPYIRESVDVGRSLLALSLDSLDLYQEELKSVIASQRTLTALLLLLFLAVALSLYVFVFRRMLGTLKDEEEISCQLISMIPQSVVNSNEMLADFVRSLG
ncbi:hypothetical protein GEMRC1_013643 [Eukaryota sp. GEM-RC1]